MLHYTENTPHWKNDEELRQCPMLTHKSVVYITILSFVAPWS